MATDLRGEGEPRHDDLFFSRKGVHGRTEHKNRPDQHDGEPKNKAKLGAQDRVQWVGNKVANESRHPVQILVDKNSALEILRVVLENVEGKTCHRPNHTVLHEVAGIILLCVAFVLLHFVRLTFLCLF